MAGCGPLKASGSWGHGHLNLVLSTMGRNTYHKIKQKEHMQHASRVRNKLRQSKVNGHGSELSNVSVTGGRRVAGAAAATADTTLAQSEEEAEQRGDVEEGGTPKADHNNTQMPEPGKLFYCHTTKFLGP